MGVNGRQRADCSTVLRHSYGGLWGAMGGYGRLWEAMGGYGRLWEARDAMLRETTGGDGGPQEVTPITNRRSKGSDWLEASADLTDVCMYSCVHVRMYVCLYVCMYACMHACMYGCMLSLTVAL